MGFLSAAKQRTNVTMKKKSVAILVKCISFNFNDSIQMLNEMYIFTCAWIRSSVQFVLIMLSNGSTYISTRIQSYLGKNGRFTTPM